MNKWTTKAWRFIKNNWKAVVASIGTAFVAVIAILSRKHVEDADRVAKDDNAEKEVEMLDDKKEIKKLEAEAQLIADRTKYKNRIAEIEDIKAIGDKKERMKRLAEIANRK